MNWPSECMVLNLATEQMVNAYVGSGGAEQEGTVEQGRQGGAGHAG